MRLCLPSSSTKIRGALNVCAVKAPATVIAASACSRISPSSPAVRLPLDELGVKVADITADMLGTAKVSHHFKDNTVIVGGAGSKEAIDARIAHDRGRDGEHHL